MKITVGMPTYNEEKYIAKIVLGAAKYADEIIVVDDGSKDMSAEIAEKLGAIVVRHGRNMGYGAVIQTILHEAKKRDGDILVLMDSDGQHDPDEIPLLVKPIQDGYDFVIGSRKLKTSKKGKIPFYRPWGQFVLKICSYMLSKKRYSDPESGFRALSKRTMERLCLNERGFAAASEMIYLVEKHGLKTMEVPISEIYTEDGSTLNPLRHGFGNLGRLISLISEKRPLFFFSIAGAVFTIIGLMLGANVLYIANTGGGVAVGSALVSVLFIVIGVFSVFTGLILNEIAKGKGEE